MLCESESVKATQSCLTLCNPMDYTVQGSLQARKLEWVAFTLSRGSSHPGIEPRSPALQMDLFNHLSHQGSRNEVKYFVHS